VPERNRILDTMVERLYASLATGPVLSCRPHASRQRIDLTQVAKLGGGEAAEILRELLGEVREIKLAVASGEDDERPAILRKLRTIVDDAKTYEQDTGAQVLYVGFPLLDLPPVKTRAGFEKRVLAPICFVPIQLAVRTTRPQAVTIECAREGTERVIPNAALVAWIEQTTGKTLALPASEDEDTETWREINLVTRLVCEALELPVPPELAPDGAIAVTPRADEERSAGVLASAVLGLFPVSNQNLLHDLEALAEGEPCTGPIESFVRANRALADAATPAPRDIRAERLVASADPCQARAVRLAGHTRGLVVHGPPGTGKSQTIANIIGDHLARGERVLFVCDKRTALDVVEHRLAHIGLGHLCAVIHDVQRDQRDLYRSIREQLEGLVDAKPNTAASAELARVDGELVRLHGELARYEAALARPDASGRSFHAVAGEWLAIDVPPELDGIAITGVALDALLALESAVREVLTRATSEHAATNPWVDAAGPSLQAFLARPAEAWRGELAGAHAAAVAADATCDANIPPFDPARPLAEQGEARVRLASALAVVGERLDAAAIATWAARDPKPALMALEALEAQLVTLEKAVPDPELAMVVRAQPPAVPELSQWLGALASYLDIADAWYGGIMFGRKKAARAVVERFGLRLAAEPARRLAEFLAAVRARRVLESWFTEVIDTPSTAPSAGRPRELRAGGAPFADIADATLVATARAYATLWRTLAELRREPAVLARLADPAQHAGLRAGLARAGDRCAALAALQRALACELLAPAWRAQLFAAACAGAPAVAAVAALASDAATIEGVLRMRRALATLPPAVQAPVEELARRGVAVDIGWRAVQRGVIGAELARRLAADPTLHEIDNDRLRTIHARYRDLEATKRALVRDAVLADWTLRQRERLLASTGSRLNAAGAELKRRLTLRGERAMRMRQVIAAGATAARSSRGRPAEGAVEGVSPARSSRGRPGEGAVEGATIDDGDPLFELRPVWMASPETVAQIFPRAAMFDVVVFDEASQCRLEEALPVLLRAGRVVIAGDPKQLPPTRFFESSIARSDDAEGELTEQGLFEEQQADVEDLLGAALGLEIEQCYLDVHYRSRNADLIEFSNKSFYDARLQPIPGHPRNRAVTAPLQLVRVAGVYDKRANLVEAERVVAIVKDLLGRDDPPSIGIACMNLVQRDAIADALDDAAAEDSAFAAALADARARTGAASFEGLFVKNLENVQGDERDHIIISTTYGPDPKGKFYRRFGPLASAGGGRRLNVLVTRARDEVHLVTSIPESEYAALPPPESGRAPNGAYLLYAYLAYAEGLARAYAADTRAPARRATTRTPSRLVEALARHVAEDKGLASDIYWGNDGFCIDLALRHPAQADDVTIGVLCDGSRYDKVDDPVEWDLFRTAILEGQGWQLLRVWSPHLVRDRAAIMDAIAAAARVLERETYRPLAV
jgi:restriction endonuclease-like protein/AAA domain-containing protein/uncharacterized protein DUF4011